MNISNFEINLPQFEGPFDLLLFFIERDELDIMDVPIAKITQDFLLYIQQMAALNMEIASEFIFVAATLMRIKAKSLLPSIRLDDEENEIDLKEDLIQKLIAYKQFKVACEDLRLLEADRSLLEKRKNIAFDLNLAAQSNEYNEELESFDLYKLMQVYERAIKNHGSRTQEITHLIEQYPYTIEEQRKIITSLLEVNEQLDFQTILKHSKDKVQFVYNFLAILEMLQQQLIDIQVLSGYNNFRIERYKQTV
jgi:segregation and condensation protein A